MIETFVKTYADREYRHATMLRHRGKLIAFAMDSSRRIYYTALDLDNQKDSPFDVNHWLDKPTELIFPAEIAEVGFGVVDQTQLPAIKLGSREPAKPGEVIADSEKDLFLSTTARLTADGPFQALSDGRFVYIFRQAIAGNHADQVLVDTGDGRKVALVDSTLLVDRFVLSGNTLEPKMEVRYRRSRSKSNPQSRKDSLGAKDMNDQPFFEPTQELRFVSGMNASAPGRFAVVLLPTQVANVSRWQIFAHNRTSGMIDAYNVERDADGLFNTHGTQGSEPIGYAESALRFTGDATHVTLPDVALGATFTQEAWIWLDQDERTDGDGWQQLFGSSATAKDAAPSVWVNARSRGVRVGFGDGAAFYKEDTGAILQPETWTHLAVSFDGQTYRIYTDGTLRFQSRPDWGTRTAKSALTLIGAPAAAFRGTLDELRIWDSARSARLIGADMGLRLVGREPGLLGYWRCDEADGQTLYDSTDNIHHGALSGGEWVRSDAPIGETGAVQRSSFRVQGRDVAAGISALLYYHQEDHSAGNGPAQPLKQAARVLLAAPAKAAGDSNAQIAAIDFGVSAAGRIARAPRALDLASIDQPSYDDKTAAQWLEERSTQEQQQRALNQDIYELTQEIDGLNTIIGMIDDALAGRRNDQTVTLHDLLDINDTIVQYRQARKDIADAETELANLQRELNSARVTLYEHSDFRGRTLTFGKRFVGYTTLKEHNFNDLISSINIPEALKVTVYEDANLGGKAKVFSGPTDYVGNDWNDIISSMTIDESDPFAARRSAQESKKATASTTKATLETTLRKRRDDVTLTRQGKEKDRNDKRKALESLSAEISNISDFLKNGVAVPMPLVALDTTGLSVAGGVLTFAWTDEAPLLFDSATGQLGMYFRGADDQFFVTYYKTLTQRAQYHLNDEAGADGVVCTARAAEPELDQLSIAIAAEDEAALCSVTIDGPGMTETWQHVPRDPERFARVLNGQASERGFVGLATATAGLSGVESLEIPAGARRALAAGATLLAGEYRLFVREDTAAGATSIVVNSAATSLDGELEVFFVEYDYLGAAATTALGDLLNGSRLVIAQAAAGAAALALGQTASSGATLACQWTATSPGYTLDFDGQKSFASRKGDNLSSFAAARDLTMEAWARPGAIDLSARIITHKAEQDGYTLGLRRAIVSSALVLNGESDYLAIADNPALALDGPQTIEAWIKPGALDKTRYIVIHGRPNARRPFLFLRIANNQYQFGFDNGTFTGATWPIPPFDANGLVWVHLTGVFDGTNYQLYHNGMLVNSTTGSGPAGIQGSWSIGGYSNVQGGDALFKGQIDDVRIWKRARTAAEIEIDKDRRLGGRETDLVGNWRLDGQQMRDYGRYAIDCQSHLAGPIVPAESAIPYYTFFASAGGATREATQPFAGGSWTHLAAAYHQSYALSFPASGNPYLEVPGDRTLDLSDDLTIELFFAYNASPANQGLISYGMLDDGGEDDVPYALHIKPDGTLALTFERSNTNYEYTADKPLAIGAFHRIAVTRARRVERNGSNVNTYYDINFYERNADGSVTKLGSKTHDKQAPGSASGPLYLGAYHENGTLRTLYGTIAEARLWTLARDQQDIGLDIKGAERGLAAWWRLEENEGTIAYDSKASHHGRLRGPTTWVKNPDPNGSRLTLYRDGVSQATVALTWLQVGTKPQFALGALLANDTPSEFFQGELEEVRVWKTARTEEQIQDNLFGRLRGEKEDLIAYYPFDADDAGTLLDNGLRDNHLDITDASFVLSTAPIGDDTPQVRSALAGIRTPFNDLLQCRPAVCEYGDVQYADDGGMLGVLKRSYALIANGQWQLITGFKVGNLITEWVSQVQMDPQLIGFIEGAPPVPGENLSGAEPGDYDSASTVELAQAQNVSYSYASSRDSGFDLSLDLSFGFGEKSQTFTGAVAAPEGVGSVTVTSVEQTEVSGALKTHFEMSFSWLEEAQSSTSLGTSTSTRLELRGSAENPDQVAFPFPSIGRRYVPENIGIALVQSETADIFALRLQHTRALVAYQMRPNPDIEKDWNLITFPINRQYVKQGTLDGKVAIQADPDYPMAMDYSSDSSYFKPIEAYALKRRIRREEEELRTYYEQFYPNYPAIGSKLLDQLPRYEKRNLCNTYVWTADGGLFAETEDTMDVFSETFGSSYDTAFGIGGTITVDVAAAKVLSQFELDIMAGGHFNASAQKSRDQESSFQINVDLSNVEGDIYWRDEQGNIIMDTSDKRNPQPKRWPGKVDAYRFMTFYLEPRSDHFDSFFNNVVDTIWLEQSSDPRAAALRQARSYRQDGRKPPCWRVLHRVTYVSRILEEFDPQAAPSLERALRTIDIDSNYEMIKLLDPLVGDSATDYGRLSRAIGQALAKYHPELLPHKEAVIQYMALYYGIADIPALLTGATGPQEPSLNGAPAATLSVDAGAEQVVRLDDGVDLSGMIDSGARDQNDLLIAWSAVSGPAPAAFSDQYTPISHATFDAKGRYTLRLSASDGLLTSTDELSVIVNGPPVISAGDDQEIGPKEQAHLAGQLFDNGLGDPHGGHVTVGWSQLGGPGKATFDPPNALRTTVSFTHSGSYLLRLTVGNGSYETTDDIVVAVAARVTRGLQALYTFESGAGDLVPDFAGVAQPLDLHHAGGAPIIWGDGSLALDKATALVGNGATQRLIAAARDANEITVEAWVRPAQAHYSGLARILSIAGGPAARNITIGQSGDGFHAALRTSTTNLNASDRALTAGAAVADELTHLVFTRDKNGIARLFVGGEQVAQRTIGGDLSNWDAGYSLALGNEVGDANGSGRAWQGAFHLAAIYSRALDAREVAQNFAFGSDTSLPPIVAAGPDQVIDLPGMATLAGSVLSDRPNPTPSIHWSQISGPTSVGFASPTDLHTTASFDQAGVYLLRLNATVGDLIATDEVTIVVNRAPTIDAGRSHSVLLPATATLAGDIANSGLGAAPGIEMVTTRWEQIAGPAPAQIDDQNNLHSQVHFPTSGVYTLRLTADNGRPALKAQAETTITVNRAPQIAVTAPPLMTMPAAAALAGTIPDDGRGDPQAGSITTTWSLVSGPGGAAFDHQAELSTTVTFDRSGSYTLRLTVDNGFAKTSADVVVVANQAPVVDAGPDQVVARTQGALLDGTVGDDGLPEQPGKVTLRWSKVDGPAEVTFDVPSADVTMASFASKGRYTLRLTADDGAASTSDDVIVEAIDAPRLTTQRAIVVAPVGTTGTLSAHIEDDGLIVPGSRPLNVSWNQIDGPGTLKLTPNAAQAGSADLSATAVADVAGRYTVRLTVGNGTASGNLDVILTTYPRVGAGLLALYAFKEQNGSAVRDTSGSPTPLDLAISKAAGAVRRADGIALDGSAVIASPNGQAPNPLVQAIKGKGAFSIEVWLTPDDSATQTEAARLVTISDGSTNRNITLQQGGSSAASQDFFVAHVQTTAKDQAVDTKGKPYAAGRQHLVLTFDGQSAKIFLDVVRVQASAPTTGTLSSWNPAYQLALAGEPNGNRAWKGVLHLVAIYDHALSESEVRQNFEAGLI
jgi:hypothetical protein